MKQKLLYFSDGAKVLVQHCGDEFLATPEEAEKEGFELSFCWCDRVGAEMLLGAFKNIGVKVVESSVGEFRSLGGIFLKSATYYEWIITNEDR